MKRKRIAVVEPLEPKVHLSAPAPPPPALTAPSIIAPVSQGLKIVLSTDQKVYHKGQPVVMTLTETNVSKQTVTVVLGPSTDGFYATQNGVEVWASNTGPQALFLLVKTIKPGASLTLSATWNGQANVASPSSPTGTFVVHTQIPGATPLAIQILPH
jgi:hypothetical protein